MVIGVDVDGVLADFNSAFIARIIRVTGRNLFPEGYVPHTWNYPDSPEIGYTKEEVTAVWNDVKADDRFWQQLSFYDTTYDDVSKLDKLRREGHDIYFITNRMGVNPKLQTERWIRRRGFEGPTVLLTAYKGLAAQTLGLDYYIDDRWENCVDVSVTGVKTFILARRWNTATALADAEYNLTRVNSVSEMFAQTSACNV